MVIKYLIGIPNVIKIIEPELHYERYHSTMAEISISIENKYFRGEHKVITLKQQFLGIILRFLCI